MCHSLSLHPALEAVKDFRAHRIFERSSSRMHWTLRNPAAALDKNCFSTHTELHQPAQMLHLISTQHSNKQACLVW